MELELILLDMLKKAEGKEIEVSSYVVEEAYKNTASFGVFCRKNKITVTRRRLTGNWVIKREVKK